MQTTFESDRTVVVRHVHDAGGAHRPDRQHTHSCTAQRMHTRVGSAPENFLARSLAPRQSQRIKGPGEDIPALRRSKVRGRQMVFSLLEAARIEEEDMVRTKEDHGRETAVYFRLCLVVCMI